MLKDRYCDTESHLKGFSVQEDFERTRKQRLFNVSILLTVSPLLFQYRSLEINDYGLALEQRIINRT